MFHLQTLPDDGILKKFKASFPQLDPSAVSLFLTLLSTATELETELDRYLSQFGLLQGRWLIMIIVARSEDHTASPSKIALESGLTKATVSGLLDTLEKDGLIERVQCSKDRRRQHVKLSKKGQDTLNMLMPGYYRRVAMLMSTLDEEIRKNSIDALTEIRSRKKILGSSLGKRRDPMVHHIHETGSR